MEGLEKRLKAFGGQRPPTFLWDQVDLKPGEFLVCPQKEKPEVEVYLVVKKWNPGQGKTLVARLDKNRWA